MPSPRMSRPQVARVSVETDIAQIRGLDLRDLPRRWQTCFRIAVIGFDGIPMATWPTYSLTTIRPLLNIMVISAVELLSLPGGVSGVENRIVRKGELICGIRLAALPPGAQLLDTGRHHCRSTGPGRVSGEAPLMCSSPRCRLCAFSDAVPFDPDQ